MHPDTLTPEMVEPFIPLAREIDPDHGERLALFLRTLAECMSINSAATWLLDNQPWDFFPVYYDRSLLPRIHEIRSAAPVLDRGT